MFIKDYNTPNDGNEERRPSDSEYSPREPAKRKSKKHTKPTSKKSMPSYNKIEPHLIEIENLLAKGATMADVADSLGISYATFYKMRKNMPQLEDIIDRTSKKGVANLIRNIWILARGEAVRIEEMETRDKYGKITSSQKKITHLEPQLNALIELLKLFNTNKNFNP